MDSRLSLLQDWLKIQFSHYSLMSLTNDASFRRYFRIAVDGHSYVAMDAPPDKEKILPFVTISRALRKCGLMTPEVIAEDIDQGFLLLSDFGDEVYLHTLNNTNAETLYHRALDALAILQSCRHVENFSLPFFTKDFMRQELALVQQWFFEKYLNLTLAPEDQHFLNTFFDGLAQTVSNQPYVFMHRDYHSGNLMVLPNDEVGILDFQDAFMGPLTYDLASLLRDCYIEWPDALVTKWVLYYREKLNATVYSEEEFLYWFDMTSLQRHLKALLTFSRKHLRDQNPNYLKYIPRTLKYVIKVSSRYPETEKFHQWVMPHLETLQCVP